MRMHAVKQYSLYKCFSTVVVLMSAWFPFSRSICFVLLFLESCKKGVAHFGVLACLF